MDGRWTVYNGMVTEAGRYGPGSWTGWSRKPDGVVTVSGQKRKIYCIINSFFSSLVSIKFRLLKIFHSRMTKNLSDNP